MYVATAILLTVIIICSLYGFFNKRFYYGQLLYPYGITKLKDTYPVFTNGFVHTNWLHLGLNVGLIYIFSNELERILILKDLSVAWVVIVWISGDVVGGVADFFYRRKQEQFYSCGASHGAMALLASYLVLDQNYVLHLMRKIELEEVLILSLIVLFTLFKTMQKAKQLNYLSHLVGLSTGTLLGFFFS